MRVSPTHLRPMAAVGLASGLLASSAPQEPPALRRPWRGKFWLACDGPAALCWRSRKSLQCSSAHGQLAAGLGAMKIEFCGPPAHGSYTPVFDNTAIRNTASINVNGNLLRNYARSMGNVGKKEDVYDRLYSAMLREAQQSPGLLRSSGDCHAATAAVKDLGLAGCFARVSDSWVSSWGVVGAVFIDVYQPQIRPMSDKNVALIFVESPNGKGVTAGSSFVGGYMPPLTDRTDFLQRVESMAANVMHAILEYNAHASKAGRASALPPIEVLQCCLVSGGAFRHPETSKLDVAKAIVRGFSTACSGGAAAGTRPAVRFAFDEDGVFEKAVAAIRAESWC